MPRDLNAAQIASLGGVVTRPLYIVILEHSGYVEQLSSGGDVTWDGLAFVNGIDVQISRDGDTAMLRMPLTPERFAACASGAWRGRKQCWVASLPAAPNQDTSFALGDEIVLVSGFIDSSSAKDNTLSVVGISSNLIQGYTPGLSTSEISNYIPAVGSAFKLDTTSYVLKSRRTR